FRPIEKVSALLELYHKGMAGFRRFRELMDVSPDVQNKQGATVVDNLKGDIAFDDVTFGYETTEKPVLNDLSLHGHGAATSACVGPSGAGKTIICSLLPHFYDVLEGAITIDGMDIRDMTKESLRKQIGCVQQDVLLFSGTLKENIAYRNLGAPDAEI